MMVTHPGKACTKCPRRLLFVVNDVAFFLSHRLPIAQAAREAGWEVSVAAPMGEASQRVLSLGFSFHSVPLTRRGEKLWEEARSLAALVRLFRQVQPQIVHLVTIKPVLYGGLAARIARVPAVVSAVSGLGTAFLAEGAIARIRRVIVETAYRVAFAHPRQRVILQNPDDRVAFTSKGILDEYRSVLIRGSGVDLTEFAASPEPEGPPLVVLAGRMLKQKGVLEFVEAARSLKEEGIEARFALVGPVDEGNISALSQAHLKAIAKEGVVEWWGVRHDMPNVLSQAHIVCLPSYGEGVPKVLLEAAAVGRPIICTDVPGCREVVEEGVNGVLVAPRDASALAAGLRQLIADRSLRGRMGTAGRAKAEAEFSIQSVVSATLSIYDALAGCSGIGVQRTIEPLKGGVM